MFSTFSTIVRALQEGQLDPANDANSEDGDGEDVDRSDRAENADASDEVEDDADQSGDDAGAEGSEEEEGEEEAEGETDVGLGNLFAFATSVAASVQAKTNEIVSTVKDTDWASELQAFSKELHEDTQTVVHHVEDAIEHLPENAKHKDLQGTFLQVQTQISEIGRNLYAGTTDIINQVNDAIQEEFQHSHPSGSRRAASSRSLAGGRLGGSASGSAKYSRFEAEVSAMQRDSGTYCDEPEDTEDFCAWLAGFNLDGRKSDIEQIIADNAFMAELQARIVPLIVEYDAFWTRYFYRLHKLQVKHEQRMQVAQRAKAAVQEEEEVGWDDDDAPEQQLSAAGSTASAAQEVEEPQQNINEEEPGAAQAAADEPMSEEEEEPSQAAAKEEEEQTAAAAVAGSSREEQQPEEEGQPEEEEQQQRAASPSTAASSDCEPAAVIETVVDRSSGDQSPVAEDDTSSGSTGIKVTPTVSCDEEGAEANTGSDASSGGEPWCVVTSPTKAGANQQPGTFSDARPALDGQEQRQQRQAEQRAKDDKARAPAAAAAAAAATAVLPSVAEDEEEPTEPALGAAQQQEEEGQEEEAAQAAPAEVPPQEEEDNRDADDVDLSDFSAPGDDAAGDEDEDDVDEDWGFD